MKKIIPVLIAIILIIIIGISTFGNIVYEKYSYSKERTDLEAYYEVDGEYRTIILQNDVIEQRALVRNEIIYFDLSTIHQYFNDAFYVDKLERILLYTTPTEIIKVDFNSKEVSINGSLEVLEYVVVVEEEDTIYVAADYIKRYTNLEVNNHTTHIQVYNAWPNRAIAVVKNDTAIREKGGIKSPILADVAMNEEVEILDRMETWVKVKDANSIIGYVENKMLYEEEIITPIPVSEYEEPEYTTQIRDQKISLGYHSIGGIGGNDTLESMVAGTKGMNVIAPTWFSLSDDYGGFQSFGSKAYVEKAHALGLEVWGVIDDFNYNNVNNANVSVYSVLSSTTARTNLIQGIMESILSLGLDGINIDFEKINVDGGEHFAQFIRELSIECRKQEVVLSIANYVPFSFNDYYRRDVQGKVADYVIIMGYDEHWRGSGDPGSVASIGYVSSGIEKTLTQVPKEKVINALPFYTILWKITGAKVEDEYITLNNTDDFIRRMNVETHWDEETAQQFAEWTSGDTKYQIWIENEESIGVKLNVMKANDIAGVAIWQISYGNNAVWELISAYVNS